MNTDARSMLDETYKGPETANPPVEGHAGTAVNRKISRADGLEPVCEPGVDPVELCTVKELGIINRQLGCDAVGAAQDETSPVRWEAMARVGWILDRRRNPTQPVDVWLDLPLTRMFELLGLGDDDADEAATRRALEEHHDAHDPTEPAPGP